MLWGWEVDGTGSGSCPMAGFCISGVEPSGSCAIPLIYSKLEDKFQLLLNINVTLKSSRGFRFCFGKQKSHISGLVSHLCRHFVQEGKNKTKECWQYCVGHSSSQYEGGSFPCKGTCTVRLQREVQYKSHVMELCSLCIAFWWGHVIYSCTQNRT
jgi:hypothetical protein